MFRYLLHHLYFCRRKNIIFECCYIFNIFLNIFFINVQISSSSSYNFRGRKNIIVNHLHILNIFLNIFFINVRITLSSSYIFAGRKNIIFGRCYILNIFLFANFSFIYNFCELCINKKSPIK